MSGFVINPGFAGFRPSALSNLVGWWDASDPDTITIATGVSEWRDKSGNGNHVSQATGSAQPTVLSGELNGRDVISFDGTDDKLTNTTPSVGTVSTLFAVVRTSQATNVEFVTAISAPAHILYRAVADGDVRLFSGVDLDSNISLADATWAYLAAKTNGASSAVRVNGSEVTGDAGTNNWTSGVSFGLDRAGTTFMDYDLGEALVYDRALSSAEMDQVDAYLAARWGF